MIVTQICGRLNTRCTESDGRFTILQEWDGWLDKPVDADDEIELNRAQAKELIEQLKLFIGDKEQ